MSRKSKITKGAARELVARLKAKREAQAVAAQPASMDAPGKPESGPPKLYGPVPRACAVAKQALDRRRAAEELLLRQLRQESQQLQNRLAQTMGRIRSIEESDALEVTAVVDSALEAVGVSEEERGRAIHRTAAWLDREDEGGLFLLVQLEERPAPTSTPTPAPATPPPAPVPPPAPCEGCGPKVETEEPASSAVA